MHIQQIEIDNFKSFLNRTVIPFQEGFTTVSGPNGSGKSNIIDSILFCLGLSSSRTMRAEKLTDLINNLSRRREATVSIMFGQTGESDDEKVVVTRKVKDNGQSGYGSTYYLNGRVSTLTEIHDRLSQHNISPGAYNVLMQGDVTGIINMSAVERRKIIDEIAGVAEFDRKIDQAQKELESVSGSIERFTLLLGELQTRVEQLSQERDQALKYQQLKAEKQKFEDMLLTAKFLDLKKAVEAAEQNIIASRKDKTRLHGELDALEKTVQITREELGKIAAEVKRKGEDQQIALKKQIEGLKGAISRKKDTLTFSAQKKQENTRQTERAHEEITRLRSKIEDLSTAVEGFEHQQKEVEKALAKESTAYEGLKTKLATLLDSSGELGETRTRTQQELNAAQDASASLKREKLDIEAERERQLREKQYQEERLGTSSSRTGEVESRLKELNQALEESTIEKEAFANQLTQQQTLVAKTRIALNEASSSINTLHRNYTQLEAQKRAYEDMNFGRSVDTVLNAGIDGVHGTLAQLGQAEEEFSVALEIALGARMRSIIVDNDAVAEEGIRLLQQTRAGRATFLPMNKMRQSQRLPMLPDDDGIVDYAINLMQFDPQYEDVFAYALGDTVIVDDMAVARKHLRKYRMVTLDGSLMEKTGAMTGGSDTRNAGGKLSSGKSDQQLRELREQLESEDLAKDKLEKQLSQIEIRLDVLKEDYAKYLTDLQGKQLEHDTLKREAEQLKQTAGSAVSVDAIDARLKELNAALAEIDGEIATKAKEIETLEASLAQIDAKLPTAKLEGLKTEMEAIEFQMRNYEGQVRNILSDIQSKKLEIEFQDKGIQSYTEQIEHLAQNNLAMDKENAEFLEEIAVIETQIKALESQTSELDEELQRLQAERDKIQAKLIEEEQEKYNKTRQINLIDEQILAYQARKRELQPEINIAKAALIEAGLDPDEVVEADLPAVDEVHKSILSITRKMEAMEPVNMRAIQDYDEVMSRHQELTDKINTLTREREDLGVKISGYSELKFNAFMQAFDNVNTNFVDIFADLSDGEGRLVLTNPADPFSGGLTIEAQPRGKKMQRLESMSGGEKSLTALAFVFSFQRYMPAPFYAFDEVDMFLDGINAEKLAHMVRKQSDSAQFIVVSLRKPMLQNSDRTVGVTQKRDGISKVTGVLLSHAS